MTGSFGKLLVLPAFVLGVSSDVAAQAPLNSDAALTPPQGGFIIRGQWRYSRLAGDAAVPAGEVHLTEIPLTLVYGVKENLALLGTLRILDTRIDLGSGVTGGDTGFGDIPLLAKYRFHQEDKPGKTTRWAAIGGLEVPTFDNEFSSDSFDPIIGTVWTHQELDWELDWDVLYKFNTAGGVAGDDELRGDFTATYRLLGGESDVTGPWGLYAIGELNARYFTDGSAQLLGSPGLQYITPRFILEAGVQLPIGQDLKSPRLDTDYTVVLSLRFQW